MTEAHGLGPLEMRILGLLRAGETVGVAEIRDRLARDGADLAYTTVMTVLGRLHAKGLVSRTKDGNRYLYKAAKRAPRVLEGMLDRVKRALFAGDRAAPILTLLEDEELSAEELRALRRVIDEKLREKKG